MAISRDTFVSASNRGSSSPVTWNHTVATDGVLYVVLGFNYPASDPVTAVTFDGDAMTLIKKDTSNSRQAQVWGILAPTTGSSAVVSVSFTSGTCHGGSVSYTGADTTGFSAVTPVESHNTGTSTSTSTTITTTVDGSIIVGLGWADNAVQNVFGDNKLVGTNSNILGILESDPTIIDPAATTTLTVGTSIGNDWLKLIGVVVEPSSLVASSAPDLRLAFI